MTTTFRGLDRQRRRAEAAISSASRWAVQEVAREALTFMWRISPRDTNRYSRAWAMANNAAGLRPLPVADVKATAYAAKYRARLEAQVNRARRQYETAKRINDYWTTLVSVRYDRTGRRGRWERDARRKQAAALKRELRAQEVWRRATVELELFSETGLVIGGRKAGRRPGELRLSDLSTVRVKEYGGTGAVVATGRGWVVTATNLEPHAAIVERRHRVVARAQAMTRARGFAQVGNAATRRFLRDGGGGAGGAA